MSDYDVIYERERILFDAGEMLARAIEKSGLEPNRDDMRVLRGVANMTLAHVSRTLLRHGFRLKLSIEPVEGGE